MSRPLTLTSKELPKPAGAEPAGPIGWWKREETVPTTANVAVSKLKAPEGWNCAPASCENGLEFDGTKTWIECCDSSDLSFRGGVSVAGWFKVRAFDQPMQTLLSKGNAWCLRRQGEKNRIEFALTGPTTTGSFRNRPAIVRTRQSVNDGQWHHLAASYDGKRVVLFLDGTEQDAVMATGFVALNNVPVTLGDNGASRGRLFNGWMNDVRLYDRGLSPDEIKTLCEKRP